MSEYPDVQVTVSLNIWCLPGTSKSGRAVNGVSPVNVLFHAGTDVSLNESGLPVSPYVS